MFVDLEQANVAELHAFRDPASGLRTLIAIHSTRLGPALGGCRCLPYADDNDALRDALRLARGMSYKAALAGLPLGGGKAVILEPPGDYDRAALFRAFGGAVERLGGRYITAVDAGTGLGDLDQVARVTEHVRGHHGDGLDPSPYTALGVFAALQTAVRHRLNRGDLRGLHFAIQGVGHVGGRLARLLARAGARLTLADTDERRLLPLAERLRADTVAVGEIHDLPCDGFLPCALGGVLNAHTIPRLQAPLVVGSANNQLGEPEDAERLRAKDILYVPDYLANAGGLIALALGPDQGDGGPARIRARVRAIGDTLAGILRDADRAGLTPAAMADRHAEARLQGHPRRAVA